LWVFSGSLSAYLERRTATNFKYIREKEIMFPAVTICNLYYTQDINLKNYSTEKINFINNMTSPSFISNQVQSIKNLTLLDMNYVASRVYSSYLEKDKIGFDWKEMLMGCSFMDNSCDDKDFHELISPEFGRCYTSPHFVCKYEIFEFLIKFFKEIILTLKIQVRKGGSKYGLSLGLDVGEPDKTAIIDKAKGVIVFVHEADTEPDFSSGILVSVGTYANLEISQTNISRLPYENRKDSY